MRCFNDKGRLKTLIYKIVKKIMKNRAKYNIFGHSNGAHRVLESEHTTFTNDALIDRVYNLENKSLVT